MRYYCHRKNHTIGDRLLQELWSCYSICFNEICNKKVPYNAGVKCSNLIDVTNSAVPFLSNTVDKKTRLIILQVVFPENCHPAKATFRIFQSRTALECNHEEELSYDNGIKGFQYHINYPRIGWRYVISWENSY